MPAESTDFVELSQQFDALELPDTRQLMKCLAAVFAYAADEGKVIPFSFDAATKIGTTYNVGPDPQVSYMPPTEKAELTSWVLTWCINGFFASYGGDPDFAATYRECSTRASLWQIGSY